MRHLQKENLICFICQVFSLMQLLKVIRLKCIVLDIPIIRVMNLNS